MNSELELSKGENSYKRMIPAIEARYIMAPDEDHSLRKLAAEFEDFGVSKSTIHQYAEKNHWAEKRLAYQESIGKKIAKRKENKLIEIKERIFERDEGIMDKLMTSGNILLDKITKHIQDAGKDDNPEMDYDVISRDLNRILTLYDKIRTSYAKMRKIMTESTKSGNVTINLNVPTEYLSEDGIAWLQKQVENPGFVANHVENAEFEMVKEEEQKEEKEEEFDPTLGM